MKRFSKAPLLGASLIALCTLLAACGGGGGGGGTTPPVNSGGGNSGGGGVPSPGSTATPTPPPSPSPGATGALVTANGALAANSKVVFTCGCNGEAGTTATTDANGDFSLPANSTAIPASPAPYALEAGRNYLVVGYQGSGTQAWTMEFLGKSPATNVGLGQTSAAAQAAASLFVYYETVYNPTIAKSTSQTFDWFDIRTVAAWAQKLSSGTGLTAHETTLLSDIAAQQSLNASLYPGTTVPTWNANAGATTNATITADLHNVAADGTAMDPALPTPCPAGAGKCSPTP